MTEQKTATWHEYFAEFTIAAVANNDGDFEVSTPAAYLEAAEKLALKTAVVAFKQWVICKGIAVAMREAQEQLTQ